MRHIVAAILTLLCMTLSTSAMTRPYYFQSLNIDNGLSNNSVNVILQDHNGMMWFGTKDGLNLYNGISCRTFRKENSSLGNNFITALYEDKNGRMWIGTDEGTYLYEPATEQFCKFGVTDEQKAGKTEGKEGTAAVSCIAEDVEGNIWIHYVGIGLFCHNTKTQKTQKLEMRCDGRKLDANVTHLEFDTRYPTHYMWMAYYEDNLYYTARNGNGECHPYTASDGTQPFKGLEINSVYVKMNSYSYVGTNHGLYAINHSNNAVTKLNDEYVRSCYVDGQDQLWIGTENGIFIINTLTMATHHITANNILDPYSLSDNAIYAICRDHEDGMWIGSYFGGVNYYSPQSSVFQKTYPNESTPTVGKRIREICPGLPGTLWVGTEDKGLFIYDTATSEIRAFTHPNLYHNIHGLCKIGNELWVGTFSGGLSRIDLNTQQLHHYEQGTGPGRLSPSSVFCICHTSTGTTLLGTIGGVFRYHPETDSFEHMPELMGEFVYDMLEDHNGNLWYATYNRGLYCQDMHSGKLTHYMPENDNIQSIPSHKVTSLFEDSRHRLWICTQGGGCCSYDTRTKKFERYDTQSGFPSNVVMQVVEDQQGNLWFTTNNGLVCMKGDSDNLQLFSTANGLLSNQFNYQSGLVDTDGTIYLGSIGGLISFKPQDIHRSQVVPQLVVSDFYVFNDRANITPDGSGVLKSSIMMCDEVELDVDQNTFSLHAAVLSYHSSHMNQVLYKLDGIDQDWQMLTGNDLIHYANLPYGNYRLHIKGRSYDGIETAERVINIHINPPFYLTIWAFIIYALLLGTVVYLIYRYTHAKTLRKHEHEMDVLRQKNESELYGAKIEFFTNVAHEIRTPLTLIKSPLDNVLTSPNITPDMRDDLEVMQLNTDRLLVLVNELLDFRKTEAKGFQMHFTHCDLVQLLRHTHMRFMPFARQQQLQFTLECPDELIASVDREGFTKMTSNLLTNAIKYAATYVKVELCQKDDQIELRVCNDGDIVPLTKREEIFKSFTRYQNENQAPKSGTGVGLTLARSLAELHEGTLQMDNDPTCNRFVLTLPISHADDDSLQPATTEETTEQQENEMANGKSAYTVLVVEDNIEMQTFIRRQLLNQYHVLTANNGQQALDVLEKNSVQLIVSDVMMPIMDGMELCHRVKSDINYSHIPVILLTAKVGVQATIEGLQQGADAYIEKPFSIEHLRASIENLLKSRELLRSAYRNSPLAQSSSIAISKADEEFLNKLHAVIVTNMKDSEFSVDQMASELAMSRSSLNRKIKALLDVSPNDYMRIERLKYAAELIQGGKYKINEVCYMAGFNTPSYFAKCFQKQFGVLPNEYGKG